MSFELKSQRKIGIGTGHGNGLGVAFFCLDPPIDYYSCSGYCTGIFGLVIIAVSVAFIDAKKGHPKPLLEKRV
jgi:hypothetical protein